MKELKACGSVLPACRSLCLDGGKGERLPPPQCHERGLRRIMGDGRYGLRIQRAECTVVDSPETGTTTDTKQKEKEMARAIAEPVLTENGVAFTVMTTEFVKRDCVISIDALAQLSKQSPEEIDPIGVYRVFEANINGVARRLVAANVPGSPLQLNARSFH
jgi:hypothetical protein